MSKRQIMAESVARMVAVRKASKKLRKHFVYMIVESFDEDQDEEESLRTIMIGAFNDDAIKIVDEFVVKMNEIQKADAEAFGAKVSIEATEDGLVTHINAPNPDVN